MRGIEACLNEIFAFRLGDQGLELGGSEGVDETCLRHNKQQDLGAGERRQLVSLFHNTSFPFGEGYVTSRFVLNKLDLNLAPSCLLLRFRLLPVFVVVVAAALGSIMVVDESVFGNRRGLAWVGLWVCGCYVSWMHVECALTFSHIKSDASIC
jgi:hypothetical protein